MNPQVHTGELSMSPMLQCRRLNKLCYSFCSFLVFGYFVCPDVCFSLHTVNEFSDLQSISVYVCVCVCVDTTSDIFLMHLLMGLAEWTVYTAKTKLLCMASKVYVSVCVILCTLWKGVSVWPAVPVCVFHAHCEMRPEFALTDFCTHKMHAENASDSSAALIITFKDRSFRLSTHLH